jgi:hypothetical protein
MSKKERRNEGKTTRERMGAEKLTATEVAAVIHNHEQTHQ